MKITERPLTVFDVETTGLDTSTARVVQFGHADFQKGVLLRLHDALRAGASGGAKRPHTEVIDLLADGGGCDSD